MEGPPLKQVVDFSETLQRMGCYLYPLFFISATSSQIFDKWRTTCNRRVALNSWKLSHSREPPLEFDGRLHFFWEVAVRDIDWACRRMLRSELVRVGMDWGPIAPGDGAILHCSLR